MTLKEKIQTDFKETFKEKNEIKLSVLKMLRAEIGNAEIAKRAKMGKESLLDDEEITGVVSREIKKRRDAIEMYEKGGRKELAEKEKKESEILFVYLPEQLSEDEIRAMAKKAIEQAAAGGAKDFGRVMGILSKETKGRVDGSLVSKIVKELLG